MTNMSLLLFGRIEALWYGYVYHVLVAAPYRSRLRGFLPAHAVTLSVSPATVTLAFSEMRKFPCLSGLLVLQPPDAAVKKMTLLLRQWPCIASDVSNLWRKIEL